MLYLLLAFAAANFLLDMAWRRVIWPARRIDTLARTLTGTSR